jgi:CheY-like chemotaxis protein
VLLVVDDEDVPRSVTARMLAATGFLVLTAASGDEALRIVDSEPGVQLVVADVSMPRMNGLELAERLRQSHPALPVIFISGAMSRRQLVGFSGAYLQKPFSETDLLLQVRRLLGDI